MKSIPLCLFLISFLTLSCTGPNNHSPSTPQSLPTKSTMGNEGASGGDPLTIQFHQAKNSASLRVKSIRLKNLDQIKDLRVKEWLTANHVALANDIVGSNHKWTDERRETCGFTNFSLNAEIEFSRPTCKDFLSSTLNEVLIGKLLIHESVHHFGVRNRPEDEAFADAVANEVYNLSDELRLPENSSTEGIVLTGFFSNTNPRDVIVRRMRGAHSGLCNSRPQGGSEVLSLLFNCVGPEVQLFGHGGIDVVGTEEVTEFVWSARFELNYFEGARKWKRIEYTCQRLNVENLYCEPTGNIREEISPNAHQFNFAITKFKNSDDYYYLDYHLWETRSESIPCQVRMFSATAEVKESLSIKCWSLDGVFIGRTSANAAHLWDIEGELSLFMGPGNFYRMVSNCKASNLEEVIPGNGSILEVKASCPKPEQN